MSLRDSIAITVLVVVASLLVGCQSVAPEPEQVKQAANGSSATLAAVATYFAWQT